VISKSLTITGKKNQVQMVRAYHKSNSVGHTQIYACGSDSLRGLYPKGKESSQTWNCKTKTSIAGRGKIQPKNPQAFRQRECQVTM